MSLNNIKSLFVDPLMSFKPQHMTEKEFVEWLFSTKTRTIAHFRARKQCEIPGVYLDGGVHPNFYSKHPRKLKHTHKVLIRYDEVLNIYDLEYRGHVWRLTANQWNNFQRHVKPLQHSPTI